MINLHILSLSISFKLETVEGDEWENEPIISGSDEIRFVSAMIVLYVIDSFVVCVEGKVGGR